MTVSTAEAALAAAQAYCRWHIAPSKSESVVLDGPGTPVLMLPSLHVTAVDSVAVDYGNGAETLDATSYDWSEAGMIELRCGTFPRRFRSVQVGITHGYDTMPDDVQQIIDRLAGRAGDDMGALQQVGDVRYATTSDGTALGGMLSAAERDVLASYRLPSRP